MSDLQSELQSGKYCYSKLFAAFSCLDIVHKRLNRILKIGRAKVLRSSTGLPKKLTHYVLYALIRNCQILTYFNI